MIKKKIADSGKRKTKTIKSQKPFLRYAGMISGPSDLSSGTGFSKN